MPRCIAVRGSMPDPLLARADAALLEAERLRLAFIRERALAQAFCAYARQIRALQTGLLPTVAIAPTVSARPPAKSWARGGRAHVSYGPETCPAPAASGSRTIARRGRECMHSASR